MFDEGETKNLAAENPRIVRQLLDLLEAEAQKDNDALPNQEP
jgi:hypothetical protein